MKNIERFNLVVYVMIGFVMVIMFFGITNKADALTCIQPGYKETATCTDNTCAFTCGPTCRCAAPGTYRCGSGCDSTPTNRCSYSGYVWVCWSAGGYGSCTYSRTTCTVDGWVGPVSCSGGLAYRNYRTAYCSGGGTSGGCRYNSPSTRYPAGDTSCDVTPPTTSVSPGTISNWYNVVSSSLTHTDTFSDVGSGLASCQLYIDGTWWSLPCVVGSSSYTRTGSLTVGNHTVAPYATDRVGRASILYYYYYSITNPVCNPASVANGSVAAYPSCAITCNSGYTLSGTTCVANAPTVSLRANGSANPPAITYNTAATLSWTTTNAVSCTANSSPAGYWSGSKATSGSGVSTGNLLENVTYYLTCYNSVGTSALGQVAVQVTPRYSRCSGSACVLQNGVGINQCSNNTMTATSCGGGGGGGGGGSSWHSVCANRSCVVVNGAGTNECSTDLNCGDTAYPSQPYGVCAQGACVMVEGTPSYAESRGVSTCSNYGGTCPNPVGSAFNINSSGDLNISITKETGTIPSNDITVTVTPLSGFSDTVSFTVSDWGGLAAYSPTATFSRSLTSSQYSSGATLNIRVPFTVPSGTYYIRVRGTGVTSGQTSESPASPIKVILHNAASSTWREI